MSKKYRKSKTKLFDSVVVATTARQMLLRDLDRLTQMYGPIHHSSSSLRKTYEGAFLKKFVPPRFDDTTLESATFEKFLKVNEHMADFQEFELPDKSTRVTSKISARSRMLLRARALMHFVLSDFSEEELFQATKHGTGSSIGVSFVDTSVEKKFTLPISCTKRVAPLLNRYLSWDEKLRSAVEEFNSECPLDRWYDIVKGSRATTVEKTCDIKRMIAIEPTGNMFFQQGLMELMYRRMRKVGLDVESLPTRHKILAKESSITGRNATIDFSSASDCVSTELLRWLLPPKWFWWCDIVRSPEMTIGQQQVALNMFSTMGNAVTFPLETLVFWTLAHSCEDRHYRGNSLLPEWEDLMNVSVFGDDCIVETRDAEKFIAACESVGFIVNKEKSFYADEPFRESCGGDYLQGADVRPIHLGGPASERVSALEPWLYILLNNAVTKYRSYFGRLRYVYDSWLFTYIFALFKQYGLLIKLVPVDFPDDSGFKIADDIERFVKCYPDMKLERIGHSGGLYTFKYCRMNYPDEAKQVLPLRLALKLKMLSNRPHIPDHKFRRNDILLAKTVVNDVGINLHTLNGDREPRNTYKVRRKGGYVVAKAITSHWLVPRLNWGRR